MNTFLYAESSPVMFVDPEGLEPNASCVARYTTCFAAIGGMIGAVSGGVGGGAAGSIVPVAGTAAGAVGGSQMGAAGGAALGAGVGYYAGNAMCPAEPIYIGGQSFNNESSEEKARRCEAEWRGARAKCSDLLGQPNSQRPPGIWGGGYDQCVRGQVAQDCGGNRVTR